MGEPKVKLKLRFIKERVPGSTPKRRRTPARVHTIAYHDARRRNALCLCCLHEDIRPLFVQAQQTDHLVRPRIPFALGGQFCRANLYLIPVADKDSYRHYVQREIALANLSRMEPLLQHQQRRQRALSEHLGWSPEIVPTWLDDYKDEAERRERRGHTVDWWTADHKAIDKRRSKRQRLMSVPNRNWMGAKK